MRVLNSILASTLAVAGFWFIVPVPTAEAQTANNLNCNRCVQRREIANLAVGQQQLGNSSVFSVKIRDRSIAGIDIAEGAISSSEVADDSLRAVDLADEAGLEFDDTAANIVFLSSTITTYETVTLTAPRAGFVSVNAAGWFNFLAGGQTARCWITTGTGLEGEALAIAENDNVISWLPWSLTRVYEVPAGSFTINLNCNLLVGSDTRLGATHLNALFVPTRY